MQLLSEPSGGSDVAGAVTTAVRDGDDWVLNGSKIWTTGAWWSDWALCLARTNWDVPKHRGLTVFMLPLNRSGVEVNRIELLSGSREFCQEFLTDVRIPDSDRIGEVNDGWTVGTRWMFHERMLSNSPYATMAAGSTQRGTKMPELLAVARDAGRLNDPVSRDLIGEARMLELANEALQQRIGQGIATGAMSDQAVGIARLMAGLMSTRLITINLRIHRICGRRLGRRRHRRRVRNRLSLSTGLVHCRRHHRDGPQRNQRTRPRHAPRAHARPEHCLPRHTEESVVELSRYTDLVQPTR